MKILTIGDVNVDLILPLGIPKKGKQVVVGDLQLHGGGCAANFALACAKLGAESKLVGRIADDAFGRFVLGELGKGGVDTRDVVTSKSGKTGATVALVEGAERSFITYRGENAIFSEKDVNVSKLDADLIHFPSFFLLEKLQPSYPKLMKSAAERGALVSFDTGWDPLEKWSRNKSLVPTLRNVDVFLPNVDEARAILKSHAGKEESLIKSFHELGVGVIAIKDGARGCVVSDGSRFVKIPAFRTRVIDPTGAGDVFNAAFLLAYLSGSDIVRAGRFANAAAAISLTGVGWSRYPTSAHVNQLLQKSGFSTVKIKRKII